MSEHENYWVLERVKSISVWNYILGEVKKHQDPHIAIPTDKTPLQLLPTVTIWRRIWRKGGLDPQIKLIGERIELKFADIDQAIKGFEMLRDRQLLVCLNSLLLAPLLGAGLIPKGK